MIIRIPQYILCLNSFRILLQYSNALKYGIEIILVSIRYLRWLLFYPNYYDSNFITDISIMICDILMIDK